MSWESLGWATLVLATALGVSNLITHFRIDKLENRIKELERR